MKQILLKILLITAAVHALLFLVVAYLQLNIAGFSWWTPLAFVVAFVVTIAACWPLMKPLGNLEANMSSFLTGKNSPRGNPFERIVTAFKSIENQLDRQTTGLAENQERLDAVLSGMVEGVIGIDASGKILFSNRAARSILSMSSENFVGKPLVGMVRHQAVQKATRAALETKKTIESSFQTLDSPRREISFRVSPMAGHPMPGMTLVFNDNTEIVRLENVRREFVANVSHELKTPLASIKAYAETLRMGAIHNSPENLQFLEQIERQSEVLNQQIQDLLQLARVESGRETFRVESVDADEFCQYAIERFSTEAKQKGIELAYQSSETDGRSLQVWADREALQTIMANLISNAIRYSPPDGRVVVTANRQGEMIVVEIKDSGIGIAHEHQQRIFERFFRVDRARSRELGGTGLGLAIVKHLVHSLDGKVELKSKLGVGSTFIFSLPIAPTQNCSDSDHPEII